MEHACNILTKSDILYESFSQADYDKIFLYRSATIVLYDNEITFFFSSTKLNKIIIEKKYRSITGEMLQKTRILWESFGRHF